MTLRERLEKCVGELNCKTVANEDIIKFDVDGEEMSWGVFLKADSTDSFACFSIFPTRIPLEKAIDIAVAINRINGEIWFGSFELVESSGKCQLRLRTSAFVPEQCDDASADIIISSTINYNLAIMNNYAKEFLSEIYSKQGE